MIVADTDVLIDALHGREPVAGKIAAELRAGRLATTAISVFELKSGVRTPEEGERIDRLLGALTVLPLDQRAGAAAAAARRALEAEGRGIGLADYLIAGVCLDREAVLLSRNQDHFERVPGLVLGSFDARPA